MSLVFITLTVLIALGCFVVAKRMHSFTVRCRAKDGRLAIMMGGVATLVGLGASNLFNAFDHMVLHPSAEITPSVWTSAASAAVIIVWFEMFGRVAVELALFEHRLRRIATIDTLTGIFNRRACLERGRILVAAAKRFGRPLTVMMIDIDHFKQVNDRHGHKAGDDVLRRFASVVKACLRQVDVFGRLGGEEFAVLMPETTEQGAVVAAERIRKAVEKAEFDMGGQSLSITASIGSITGHGPLELALKKADEAMYRAKRDGRNRVVMAGKVESP
jgi:diguanylate cyclase (GGDEF)-like protein